MPLGRSIAGLVRMLPQLSKYGFCYQSASSIVINIAHSYIILPNRYHSNLSNIIVPYQTQAPHPLSEPSLSLNPYSHCAIRFVLLSLIYKSLPLAIIEFFVSRRQHKQQTKNCHFSPFLTYCYFNINPPQLFPLL